MQARRSAPGRQALHGASMYPNVIQYETRLQDLEQELERLTHEPDAVVVYERKGLGRRAWAFVRRRRPAVSAATQRA
jgi:hypothetical protein